MTTYLVTRHEGTRLWAMAMSSHGRLPFTIDEAIEHLDVESLSKGDVVVGTLPVGLIAELQTREITFWALDLAMPREDRGESQSGLKLPLVYDARFTRYDVRPHTTTQVSGHPEDAPAVSCPAVSLIPVSAGLVPAAVAYLHKPTAQVNLLETKDMQGQGKSTALRRWLEQRGTPPAVELCLWDDASYETLLAGAEQWAATLAKERRPAVVVHLTGGNKPMSMALQRAFGKKVGVFRDGLSGPYVHASPRGKRAPQIEDLLSRAYSTEPIRSVLNVRDLFELEGFGIKSADSASPGFQSRMDRTSLFEAMMDRGAARLRAEWYQMLHAAEKLARIEPTKEAWKTGTVFPKVPEGDLIKARLSHGTAVFRFKVSEAARWAASRLGDALTGDRAIKVKLDDHAFELVLTGDPAAELNFLKGGWMECWVARHFVEAAVDDWAVGLKVSRGAAANEIDIAVACGNRLLIVEVKSGNLAKDGKEDSKGAEALYKLDSIAGSVGGQFCDRWLVSLKALDGKDSKRAREQKIQVYADAQLPSLRSSVDAWVGQNRLPLDQQFMPSRLPAPVVPAPASKVRTDSGRPIRK